MIFARNHCGGVLFRSRGHQLRNKWEQNLHDTQRLVIWGFRNRSTGKKSQVSQPFLEVCGGRRYGVAKETKVAASAEMDMTIIRALIPFHGNPREAFSPQAACRYIYQAQQDFSPTRKAARR